MKNATLLGLLAVVFGLFAIGCGGGTPWVVVRQATPDPFTGHPDFVVEPVHFDQAHVGTKTEAEYANDKKADAQDSWNDAKAAFQERFAGELAGSQDVHVGPSGTIVRPIVTFIEPGYYAFVTHDPTRVKTTVQFLDPQGAVLDEISVEVKVAATMGSASLGKRMREAGERLGKITGMYLFKRIHGQQ